MSPKAKTKATPKKEAAAPKAPVGRAPSKKSAKAAPEKEVVAAPIAEGAEEAEGDEDEATGATGAAGGGNAAALAAATTSGEMSASFKNFRHHPDMENFYRFIYENDLRLEALAIIDEMALQKQARRAVKAAKSQAH